MMFHMCCIQDEYEEIDGVYTEEKKQLNELEERFKTLQTEYDQIMEERRIARERREAAERELQQCIGAATTIQVYIYYYIDPCICPRHDFKVLWNTCR